MIFFKQQKNFLQNKKADFKTFKAYEKLQEKDKIIYDAEDKNSYYYQGKIVKNK